MNATGPHPRREYLRFNERAWGLGIGLVGAAMLWLATMILVLIGGDPVGPHLGQLAVYFPGYRVTALGAFVGAVYGFLVGYALGRAVSALYNRFSRSEPARDSNRA